jgi:fumarate hydratase class II
MTNMVCCQVIGLDAAVAVAASMGQLELNVMMPLLGWDIPHMEEILIRAMHQLAERCVEGMTADTERGLAFASSSLALVTALNRRIGYAAAAEIAKLAIRENIPVTEAVKRTGRFSDEELKELLDLLALTRQPEP